MASRECIVVLAFHPYPEIPCDRWFSDREFVYVVHAGNADSFQDSPSTVHVLADYADTGALFELIERIARERVVTHISARAERDMIRAAALRMHLGIGGLDVDQACAFRDKHEMYRRAAAGGVPVAPNARVVSHAQALEFLRRHGKSVVKPVFGSGSSGVAVLQEERDLARVFGEFGNVEWLIQQFCPGEMYHLDGLWDGGRVRDLTASRYVNTCISFQDGGFLGSAIETGDAGPVDYVAVAGQVLGALEVGKPLVFHLELFVDGDRWTFCEVACRPGGVRVVKANEIATGVNLDRALLAAELQASAAHADVSRARVSQPAGWLVIPPRQGRVKDIEVPDAADWIAEVRVSPHLYSSNEAARKSGDYLLTCVVTGDSTDAVRERIATLGRRIDRSIVMEAH